MTSLMTKTFTKYLRLGIIPRLVRGNWMDGDYMYSIYHDDVQYTIDDMGDYEIDGDVSYILECLESRDLIIERHHDLVKSIYDFVRKKTGKEVWVRVDSGIQLNCTFGDSTGELAQLMLGFIDPEQYNAAVDELKAIIAKETGIEPDFEPASKFVLLTSGEKVYEMFEDFEHEQVEVLNIDDTDFHE